MPKQNHTPPVYDIPLYPKKLYTCRRCGAQSVNRFYCPPCHRVVEHGTRGDEAPPTGNFSDMVSRAAKKLEAELGGGVTPSWREQRSRRGGKNKLGKGKGYYFRADKQMFEASIQKDGKRHFLGLFSRADEARMAYEQALKQKLKG